LGTTGALPVAKGGSRAGVAGLTAAASRSVLLGTFTRVLVCLVAPNDTACTSPQQTVVTRKVPATPPTAAPFGQPAACIGPEVNPAASAMAKAAGIRIDFMESPSTELKGGEARKVRISSDLLL
jgi:hypothetical protein